MRKVWRGTDLFSVKTDLYQSRYLQLKSQNLQIYTQFSSVICVCITVHVFYLYLIYV